MEEQLARGPMDLPFLMLVLMLVGIGLIMMFDSSQNVQNNPMFYIRRQAAYAAAGLLVMYVTSKINYQRFRWMSVFVLVGAIALLVLVLTPIGVEINQVKRWLYLFLVAGPTFQPSEIAKVAVVLFFAARLSKRDTERKKKFTNRTLTGRTLNRLERCLTVRCFPWCWYWWSWSPICQGPSSSWWGPPPSFSHQASIWDGS